MCRILRFYIYTQAGSPETAFDSCTSCPKSSSTMRFDQQKPAFTEYVFRLGFHPLFRRFWKPKLEGGARFLPLEKPCFVYGNHSNNFDPFITNMFTDWGDSTAGVLTQEYFRKPFLRHCMKSIRLMPTRKHIPDPHLIRTIYKRIQNNESFLIYPEGGRRWSGTPIPWIESTAKIFIKSGVRIYPIITHGSYISWPRWATYPRPARIRIVAHEPFQFDRKTPVEEALKLLKAPMDFDENIVADELKPKWAYKPAAGIHRLLYRDPDTGANGGIYTPDGTYVVNRAGTLKYKMLPDSTLLDESSGEILTTDTLYQRVKSLPLDTGAQDALVINKVDMHWEDEFPALYAKGEVNAALYVDRIHITGASVDRTVPVGDLLHPGVERNAKLQLFLKDEMIQLTFKKDGSALQWQDTLLRLMEQEQAAVDTRSGA